MKEYMEKSIFIRNGFIASGLANILAVLGFSKFFTNQIIPQTDPAVMSTFGLMMICVWGLVFIAVANDYAKVKWLVAVFALEKLIYGVTWLQWITTHEVSKVWEQDALAGIFYSIYGANDLMFFGFFTWVFVRLMKNQ